MMKNRSTAGRPPRSGSRPGRRSTARCVAVGAVAVGTLMLLAPAASASDHQFPPPTQDGSAGFELFNLSPFDLSLGSSSAPSGFTPGGGAPDQASVSPGYTSSWSVDYSTRYGWTFDVGYRFTDQQGGAETVAMSNDDDGHRQCVVDGDDAADWTCDVGSDGSQDTFTLHASSADMTVSATDKDTFAQVLDDLCTQDKDGHPTGADGHATCSFEPNATPPTFAESTTGFVPYGSMSKPGCYPDPARDTYQYTGSGSTSQSVSIGTLDSVSVSTSVLDVADFGFSHTDSWGQSWTHDQGYSDTNSITARYGSLATPYWYPTIGTASGDFTATLDGTTYHLDDVTIRTSGAEGANADGSKFARYTSSVTQWPMDRASWQQNCPGLPFPNRG